MLVLSRKIGEEIVIGNDMRLVVLAVQGDRVRLGVAAPPTVRILRAELIGPNRGADGPGPPTPSPGASTEPNP